MSPALEIKSLPCMQKALPQDKSKQTEGVYRFKISEDMVSDITESNASWYHAIA